MTTGIIRTGDATSIGTGTTKTKISPTSGLFLPKDAVALLKVVPKHGSITPKAAETINTLLELESSSIKDLAPHKTLFAPIGAGLGVTYNTFTGHVEWDVNARLQGGEALHVWATALVANTTTAPEALAFVIVSNDPRDLMHPNGMMKSQYHAEVGTITSTGTTADRNVPGTKYSLSGVRMITELFGTFHPKTIVAGDVYIGEVSYTSSEFMDSYEQTLPLHSLTFGLGTTGSMLIPGVSRQEVRIPIKPGVTQVNIQDNLNFGGAIGTAGSFIDGVVYV